MKQRAASSACPERSRREQRAGVVVALMFLALAVAIAAMAQQQLKVPDAEQFVGKPQGTPIAGDALHLRTQQVAALLRCPVCQGLSVADSPSEMAVNMKGQVRELLARGYTQEQILRYFERSYGQFVLLKPKFNGVSAAVWILPLVAIAIGIVLVVSKAKKLERTPAAGNRQPSTDNPADDPYVTRVRDLVEKS